MNWERFSEASMRADKSRDSIIVSKFLDYSQYYLGCSEAT